uniref:Protein kinase domain-containing protein n=1 Tax=Acrobeloides nanus TaxID=290746 RepID=A0A914EBP5_9BILA
MNTTLNDSTVNSFLAVLPTGGKIYDMLLDTYPFNSILTSESLLCIAYKATAQHIHEFWEITFVVRQAPNYTGVLMPSGNLLLLDQPSVNEAYQINSEIVDPNYHLEYIDFLPVYNGKGDTSQGTYLAYNSSSLLNFIGCDGYTELDHNRHLFTGSVLTLMRTQQFHYSDSFIVFRQSFLTQNCRSGYPTCKYGSPNNDTIRTDANINDMNNNGVKIFCRYYWAMDKRSPNGVNLFYRKINYFIFESSSENAINVATVTTKDDKSQVYKDLFQIDQNSYKEWKNVIIFGRVITFDIPPLSTFTINGDISESSDFIIEVSDIEKTSGILMSPFYPDLSQYQSINYTLNCKNCKNFGYQISITDIDIPDNSTYLHIWLEGNDAYDFDSRTQELDSNSTFQFYGNILHVDYETTSNTTGFVLRYSTIVPTPKKPYPFWLIGVGAGVFLLLIIGAGLYLRKRCKDKEREVIINELVEHMSNYPSTANLRLRLVINNDPPIGKGVTSLVYRSFLQGPSPLSLASDSLQAKRFQNCDVALKVPKSDTSNKNESELLIKEITLLKELGSHGNVVAMLGYYIDSKGLPCMVLELAEKSLLSYVEELRDVGKSMEVNEAVVTLWQISQGMQFVASKSVIHRDLAARNVLLTNTNVAKITDFGLCCKSDEESQTYQASIHKPLPMRWLPIEALADRIFSEKSDVWSFGILTYEIFSRGKVPYETMDHNQMYEFLKNGQRLDCPEDAPNQIYAIMMSCWEKEPDDRPSFGDLVNCLYEMREYASDLYTYGYNSQPRNGTKMTAMWNKMTTMEQDNIDLHNATVALFDLTTPPPVVHQCAICDKIFRSYRALVMHAAVHSNELPYVCETCGKAFRYRSNLITHKSLHEGY